MNFVRARRVPNTYSFSSFFKNILDDVIRNICEPLKFKIFLGFSNIFLFRNEEKKESSFPLKAFFIINEAYLRSYFFLVLLFLTSYGNDDTDDK